MNSDYLITEKPFKALTLFSLPMIIGNVVQQTYTLADSAIVGRFVGQNALAAVGASYSLTNIFICVAIGGGAGASVLVSRFFGAGTYKKMKTAVSTALISFLFISLLLGALGFAFGRQMMVALQTPSEILDMATQYLNIYFFGLPFLFMYSMLSAMFNALGKSKIPLCFLIFSSVFNIFLDWIFVTRFNMGVPGVAWATLIAQGISAVLSFAVLVFILQAIEKGKTTLFSFSVLRSMTAIALPSVLQQSTVAIGMMLVQSVVNSFGTEVLAGFSAAMRVEALCVVPMVGIGNAVSSYTAQNIGANRHRRVVMGYRASNWLVNICSLIIFLVLELFNRRIVLLFLGSEGTAAAVATGCDYLAFMGFFFCLIGYKMTVDSVLRGSGDMRMFTVANLVNLLIRVFVAKMFAPRFGIEMVWYAVPIGWFANWAISYARYRTGKWRRIAA